MMPNLNSAVESGTSKASAIDSVIEWRDYAVMGGVLRSAMEFPELLAAPALRADWTLRVVHTKPPCTPLVLLGERALGREHYRLSRMPSGFRLEYSHAGCFDVSTDDTSIIWYPCADASVELARSIVLGPALAIALETAGLLCLHGSAVALGEQAIAFVGGKYHGKSTLAVGLTIGGARLISDDLIAVVAGPPARVRPGIASARLWADAARELRVQDHCTKVMDGVKRTVSGFSDQVVWQGEAPLAAVYVLEPKPDTGDKPACWRVPLAGTDAAVSLAHQTKLVDSLVGYHAAGERLRVAVAVVKTVPIYTLHVVRNFERLTEVVQQLRDWHTTDTGVALAHNGS